MRRILTWIILFSLSVPLAADPVLDPVADPTVQTLEETVIPYADPVDLARRLRGMTEFAAPEARTNREVGEKDEFHISDSGIVKATLRAVGEHIYLWVEDGADIPADQLDTLAAAFDERIYSQLHDLWGTEDSPGVDGDPRLHALFAFNLGRSTAAYFSRRHTFPNEVFPASNEREMFFVNLDAYGLHIATPFVESVLAHEFQHMIRNNLDPNEDTWLNEAFSTFTELYLGHPTSFDAANDFFSSPGTQLNTFGLEDTPRAVNYGAGFTFLTYFYERYGLGALKALSDDPANGLISVNNVLQNLGEPGVDIFFADWVLANTIQDTSVAGGLYGYETIPRVFLPIPRDYADAYPYTVESQVNQYGTDYFYLRNIEAFDILTISLDMPQTVQLVPADMTGNHQAWYSNRGDVSNMTLTRAFDLSDVDRATLYYRLWYELEPDWDYGYVMVSTDGGTRWDILATPNTTTDNPQDNSYGAAYNGYSNGWLDERLSLDAYTGQEILVRFELISDDAVNLSGMLVDDVAVPEIGYASDFETDGGGWEATGWLLTDNILPQNAWVQVVQFMPDDVHITRWSAPEELARDVPLVDGVQRVVIAVSPFAPVTTVPMPYTLHVGSK